MSPYFATGHNSKRKITACLYHITDDLYFTAMKLSAKDLYFSTISHYRCTGRIKKINERINMRLDSTTAYNSSSCSRGGKKYSIDGCANAGFIKIDICTTEAMTKDDVIVNACSKRSASTKVHIYRS